MNETDKYNLMNQPRSQNGLIQIFQPEKLLSINKVSKLLGIRYDSVKRLIITGKIRHIKIDKRIKIPYMSLLEFINTQNIANSVSDNGIISSEETQNKINALIKEYSR